MPRSAEWIAAYRKAQPTGQPQKQFISLLAEPIHESEAGKIVSRVDRFNRFVDRLSRADAAALYGRLADQSDPLGRLFVLELETDYRRHLRERIRQQSINGPVVGLDERGVPDRPWIKAPDPIRVKKEDKPGKEKEPEKEPEKEKEKEPEKEKEKEKEPEKEKEKEKEKEEKTDKDKDRRKKREEDKDGGGDFIKKGLRLLGGGAALAGLMALPSGVLLAALKSAFFTFCGAGNIRNLAGMAGEAAFETIAKWYAEKSGGLSPVNLNDIRKNFPYADFMGEKLYQVKNYMVDSRFAPPVSAAYPSTQAYRKAYNKWVSSGRSEQYNKQVISRYTTDLIKLIFDPDYQKSAAEAILKDRDTLTKRGVWPAALKGKVSVEQMTKWVVDNMIMVVPEDHRSMIQSTLGQTLYEKYKKQRRMGWRKDLPEKEVVETITRHVGNIRSTGVSTHELRTLVEMSKRLPAHRHKPGGSNVDWPSDLGEPPDWTMLCP